MRLIPDDEHNAELVRHAAPSDWRNPSPRDRYHLVAIGGGTAGIISALATAGLGGRAALVERHLLGGDCLNYGCVPSKALLRAARAAYDAGRLEPFGLRGSPPQVDFAAVMERMRRLRAQISHHDAAERFRRLGVDVFLGEARFTASDEVAAGRKPNVEGLGLEAAGVDFTADGVAIDDFLRTGNPFIYAAGDVCGTYQFTHAADAMARACVRNALFFGRQRLGRMVVPRTTYTDPEVAHVGLTTTEAHEWGVAIDSYRQPLAEVDRAVLDGQSDGFAVVHTRRGTGRIVGATIVAAHAGEMIGEITLMMTRGIKLGKLSDVIHCYPTQAEALRRIADQYQRTRLTPMAARVLKTILAWRA
jgi:pyruvate/2-oxoglutarate dehydrogenase complex dihydrolipoamide dehydrogenase (E3) component